MGWPYQLPGQLLGYEEQEQPWASEIGIFRTWGLEACSGMLREGCKIERATTACLPVELLHSQSSQLIPDSPACWCWCIVRLCEQQAKTQKECHTGYSPLQCGLYDHATPTGVGEPPDRGHAGAADATVHAS